LPSGPRRRDAHGSSAPRGLDENGVWARDRAARRSPSGGPCAQDRREDQSRIPASRYTLLRRATSALPIPVSLDPPATAWCADGLEHILLGILGEGFAQLLRRLDPVDRARQDDATGALAVEFRGVDARRYGTLITESERSLNQAPAGPDHHAVAGAKVLLRAVVDRPHTLGNRLILHDNAGQAGIAVTGSHLLTVEHVVVAGVRLRS